MKSLSSVIRWTPRVYDRLARFYDIFARCFLPYGEKGRLRVVEGLSSGSIVDVGCGTGTLLAMASANGLECYGIDTSQGMLDQARSRVPNAEFKQASFYNIPYPDACFDYVVETNALSGVEIDVKQALSEMLRVCKVGGEIRIADGTEPPRRTWRHNLLERLWILTGDLPKDYVRIFGELGCKVAKVEVLGGSDMYQFFQIEKEQER